MPPNSSCSITVGFDPQKTNTLNSTLTISDNHLNNPLATQMITLTGNGTGAPFAVLSTRSLDFTATPRVQGDLSGTIPTKTFTIINKGTTTLNFNINGVNLNSASPPNVDFTLVNASSNSCLNIPVTGISGSLPVGASCTVAVQFTPRVTFFIGTRTAVLYVNNASGVTNSAPVALLLTGTATGAAQTTVCLAGSNPCQTSINFGSVPQANPVQASTQQVVTVTNTGKLSLSLNNIFFRSNSSQFQLTNPPTNKCIAFTTVLNPGQSCNIGMQFEPTLPNQTTGLRQTGVRTDFLVVQDNSGNNRSFNSEHFVTLMGNATGTPAASIDKTSLTFPTTAMGNTSAAQTVVVTNPGDNPLIINTPFFRTGDFSRSAASTCPIGGTGLAQHTSCNIVITFNPQNSSTQGTRTDVLTIPTNAGNDNNTNTALLVFVTGADTGGTTTLTATVSPSALNFGNQPVSTLSTPINITIKNTSAFAMGISAGPEFGSFEFFVPNNCNNPQIQPGQSCTLAVYFQPFVLGPKHDILDISLSGSAFATYRIPLSGVGTGTQSFSPSPASLAFGNTPPGGLSASQQVTITNNGTVPTTISSIQISPFYDSFGADFTQTNNCPINQFMPVGASCVVNVVFTPQPVVFGTTIRTATMFIQEFTTGTNIENTGGGILLQQTVALSGTVAGVPALTLTPATLNFMDIRVGGGQFSNPIIVKLTNTGNATLSPIPSIGSTVGELSIPGNTCNALAGLVPGGSCHIWVRYSSGTVGARIDTLNFLGNMNNTPSQQSIPAFAFATP